MIDYMTRTEWFLLGVGSGVVVTLVACVLCAGVLLPDLVLKARRRRGRA